MELMQHQKDAVKNLSSGKVLYGRVGSGKTAAVLGYYVDQQATRDIYVITTAKKRDSEDWERDAVKFGVGVDVSCYGKLVVDSWNNIGKYTDISGAFFVFDEQRLVGHGAWVKAFLKITKNANTWVLLSATPGDNWMDYCPVFVANGYFKNKTEFLREHVKYKPYFNYPVIDYYLNTRKLELLRNEVLVEMPYDMDNERVLNWWDVGYDRDLFDAVYKRRWNIYEERPIKNAGELFRLMRKVVNSDLSRYEAVLDLLKTHPRLIIFYNFNYELDILRGLSEVTSVGEWNGHKKTPIPSGKSWVYLVQYVAGAEGWNCTSTDAMVLYSLTYSYKNFEQAQGRIDRLDNIFKTLYFYVFLSHSEIDISIRKSLINKESFNEKKALKELGQKVQNESVENGHENDDFDALERKYSGFSDDFVECCQI